MEWSLFWTIAAQILVALVILLFAALVGSFIAHVLRGPRRKPQSPDPVWTSDKGRDRLG